MAVDRMLRAEFRYSEKVNSWPIPLRHFWTLLWGYCDDYGRGRNDARLIRADAFPLDDEVTVETVSRWMQALQMAGVIECYEVRGKAYFEVVSWDEHQAISYRKKSSIPDNSGSIPENSGKVRKSPEHSGPREGEEKGREVEGEGESADAPPSRFCSKHPRGTTRSCVACKEARLAFEAAEKSKPTPAPWSCATNGHQQHRTAPGICRHCSERIEATA